MLIVPFPESALNEEAGKLFMEDYDSYFKYAKLMTDVHAKPKVHSNKMEIEKTSVNNFYIFHGLISLLIQHSNMKRPLLKNNLNKILQIQAQKTKLMRKYLCCHQIKKHMNSKIKSSLNLG